MKWKAGLAVLMLVAATGCGNAANNAGNAAGNAAGFVGNAAGDVVRGTGNVVRGTGNVIGGGLNAAGNAAGAAGNALRGHGVRGTADLTGGTQTVVFNHRTKTIELNFTGGVTGNNGAFAGRTAGGNGGATWAGGTWGGKPGTTWAGGTAGGRQGAAWAGGSARPDTGGTAAGAGTAAGTNGFGNWSGTHTISIPVGWGISVKTPPNAAYANNVYAVPYQNTGTTGARTGVGLFGTGTIANGAANNGNGNRLGTSFRQGIGAAGGHNISGGVKFTPTKPGLYAIVVSGNGYTNHIVDFVNVTSHSTATPSIVTTHNW